MEEALLDEFLSNKYLGKILYLAATAKKGKIKPFEFELYPDAV